MAAAVAGGVTAAQARGGGGGHAPAFRPAPTFRPAPHFTPQTHVNVNRHPPRFTQSPSGGRHIVHGGNQHHHNNSTFHPNFPAANLQHARPTGGLALHGLKAGPGKNASFKPGTPLKPGFPAVTMHNRFWPLHKGPMPIWFAGHRHFFVPVGLLGVVLIGDSYWYPDGYVSIAGPLCTGLTPDGCQLEWRMVDFEDGGSAAQCVQYCPQAGPPPAQVASLPPPPVLAQGGSCQLTIYADPNFGGLSAPTADNQPLLSETGWKDEIASIQVQAGTWDFFSADNFSGESIRMSAGSYPTLAPEWSKHIGSFMCVEPGAGGA